MPATATTSPSESEDDELKARAARLGLYGLLANWEAHVYWFSVNGTVAG